MGDNKISEAAVEAAMQQFDHAGDCPTYKTEWMRAALEAALPHLQGEAVPVAFTSETQLTALRESGDGLMGPKGKRWNIPLYTHPQPAELSEVSGNSGELAVEDLRAILVRISEAQPGDNSASLACDALRELDAALAATGKQQVGEVHGDARRILAKHMRRIAAAHNVPRLGTEAAIVEGGEEYDFWMDAAHAAVSEALASRQPVGQEPVDAIERIARLLWLRSCNRHHDGSPFTGWDALGETLKEYSRKEAREYEALRNAALWPAGRENYTSSRVIR